MYELRTKPNTDSASGVLGLCLSCRFGGRNGTRHWDIVIYWREPDGTRRQKLWAVEKYGFRNAVRSAAYWLYLAREDCGNPFSLTATGVYRRAYRNLLPQVPEHLLP